MRAEKSFVDVKKKGYWHVSAAIVFFFSGTVQYVEGLKYNILSPTSPLSGLSSLSNPKITLILTLKRLTRHPKQNRTDGFWNGGCRWQIPVRALSLAIGERHKKELLWLAGVTSWECHELWCTFHHIIWSRVKCRRLHKVRVKQYWCYLGTTTVFLLLGIWIMKYYLPKLWISHFLKVLSPYFHWPFQVEFSYWSVEEWSMESPPKRLLPLSLPTLNFRSSYRNNLWQTPGIYMEEL